MFQIQQNLPTLQVGFVNNNLTPAMGAAQPVHRQYRYSIHPHDLILIQCPALLKDHHMFLEGPQEKVHPEKVHH